VSKRFSNGPGRWREPDQLAWSDLPPLYWKALAITIILGVVTGLGWIAWKLIELHVLK
jgi:hypothetical protein